MLSKLSTLVLLIVFSLSATPAWADCMEACMGDHNCAFEYKAGRLYNAGTDCGTFQSECEIQCHRGDGSFGALAYGKTSGAWGMSGAFADEKSAAEDAMSFCRENGADCKIVLKLHEACAAFAEGGDDSVGWASGATAAEAENEALKTCRKKAGAECDIQLWHCYYP